MSDNNNCEYLVTLQDPFPLFPGESLEGSNAGGKLVKERGLSREWSLLGYICQVGGAENRMRNVLNPHLHSSSSLLFSSIGSYDRAIHKLPVVFANHAIHLRALVDLPEDKDGHAHKAGDKW